MAKELNKTEVELETETLNVARVVKVVRGGRRFRFKVLVAVGDRKGRVGIGTGKAQEIPEATTKAMQEAKKRMFTVPLKESRTIHHDVEAKSGAGRILMKTAPAGTGIIAGGAAYKILNLAGVSDIVTKSIGSSNPHNQANATIDALKSLRLTSPKNIAKRRQKSIGEIVARRAIVQNVNDVKEEENNETE